MRVFKPGLETATCGVRTQLMRRLNQLGIRARLSRTTALINLAAQLPATVLSDLLNLHTGTATAWNQVAGNTRSGCAAELSRRRREG